MQAPTADYGESQQELRRSVSSGKCVCVRVCMCVYVCACTILSWAEVRFWLVTVQLWCSLCWGEVVFVRRV